MTPAELQAFATLVNDFRTALAVLNAPPRKLEPCWCRCDHVVEAHPRDRYEDRPCVLCQCLDFTPSVDA